MIALARVQRLWRPVLLCSAALTLAATLAIDFLSHDHALQFERRWRHYTISIAMDQGRCKLTLFGNEAEDGFYWAGGASFRYAEFALAGTLLLCAWSMHRVQKSRSAAGFPVFPEPTGGVPAASSRP